MAGNVADRRDYDVAASQSVQDDFNAIAARLEALIEARDADVRSAMSDYSADGVSDDYAAKELRWKNAAAQVRQIIDTLRTSLERSDETAQSAISKAKTAVANIG
ncbi:pore-forming ESAT-6 family protein [Demequina gelatinilytica]|uniref:pore-forming ESAT-6 family protein n=1 Tax=Demequina gelatinilytica TaxID=1638980 RepID=UPI0007857127|nr:pore-forming ESAT-6 family protein [Demequina gelatinilytica]